MSSFGPMLRRAAATALALPLFALATDQAYAQRDLGGYRLILDNGLGQSIRISVPTSGFPGNGIYDLVLPIPPAGVDAGFVAEGTAVNKYLTWNNALGYHEAVPNLAGALGTGTTNTLTKWAAGGGTLTNSGITDDGSTVSIVNEALLLSGTTGTTPASGAGTRMMWVPAKGAFRAGTVNATQWDDASIGQVSFAAGERTTASGMGSVALGRNTTASGNSSVAFGGNTEASGDFSTALGFDVLAQADYSFAQGQFSEAVGNFGFAAGYGTQADGSYSVAMGTSNVAGGYGSVAMGDGNSAAGNYAVVFGLQNSVAGNYAMAHGYNNAVPTANSFSFGLNNTNSGGGTLTFGQGNTAGATSAIALGINNVVSGIYAVGIGSANQATAIHAVAIGDANTASAAHSVALGNQTTASGNTAFAVGNQTDATGSHSFAAGSNNLASGFTAFAMGMQNEATGAAATALGSFSDATGDWSIAAGNQCMASGEIAFAMGRDAVASGEIAFAFGLDAIALGNYSGAMGWGAEANAHRSFAIGTQGSANHDGSIVIADGNVSAVTSSTTNEFTARASGGYRLFTNAALTSGVSMNAGDNSWSSISDSNRKENRLKANGEAVLAKLDNMWLGSWNYKGQDPETHRHYGPMAQEFFAAFGHDGIGVSGTDTTLASADVDGINMIAIQALIKRTNALEEENELLRKQNAMLLGRVSVIEKAVDTLTRPEHIIKEASVK